MANGTETGTVVDQVTEYMDPDKVNQLFEMGKELVIQYGLKAASRDCHLHHRQDDRQLAEEAGHQGDE